MWGLVQKDLSFCKAFSKLNNILKNDPILLFNDCFSLKIKNAVYWCLIFPYRYCVAHNLVRGHID